MSEKNASINVISSETVKRLLRDVKQMIKFPLTDNGIYYIHDETDMTIGYAMIVGPADTPYFGGFYFFKFNFPMDYPFSPPIVTYHTNDGKVRFNPNLYKSGKVCVSILNTWSGDKWSSCQTINSVLLTLCSLFTKYPLENEPGQNKNSRDYVSYHKSIEYKNIDFAVCHYLKKDNIPEPFEIFYEDLKENIIKNSDKIIEIIKSKNKETSREFVHIYNMETHINYENLEKKLIKCMKNII
jgi:ubiquitin-conjugating enzyme E2 Z